MTETEYRINPAMEQIGTSDSVVLLQENQTDAFVLDAVAKRVLECFKTNSTVEKACRKLECIYKDGFSPDECRAFVQKMIEKNILIATC